MLETLTDVFKDTVMITSFVIVIMIFIELLNVFTSGTWSNWLSRSKPLQVIIAAILGLIPGCFGGFAVVGMWTHGAISFGSLIAAMISSVGDEAFFMMVSMPEKSLVLFLILLIIGIVIGLTVDKLKINVKIPANMNNHLIVHEHEHKNVSEYLKNWKSNFRQLSFTRILLITGVSFFLIAVIGGFFEHENESLKNISQGLFIEEKWFNSIFIIMAIVVLLTFIVVDDHFLDEHLWKHIIRQHVPKIALWTFGALLLIHFVLNSVDLQTWVSENTLLVLLIAVLFGLIPESGPHLVFITMFISGTIPFSVLLANSITQDGHSSLPLLAESKQGFILTKSINLVIGLLVGFVGYLFGF
jgi:hypothetical protein